ncbi:MAG: TylF/MycF/NovP-related O-methyltransferase [Reichenbachiella sp.]|uniref:TylF/MycF/NovP-related O-methyltransferase n=1 Tax=Reichenbachiella sp. TaxID=2184521 RepID=UPI0029666DC7|nr:TylF/MycF/NovP-related O-methyltransferase [Reichenbachiella sp.]MDW3208243.1 TylF/MycF/NovP-related O-methyltransferase [Reichenbachiella sp.]
MSFIKTKAKEFLAPILYKRLNSGLQPERLYYYLDTLWNKKDVEGGVLEIGCHLAGTSIIAKNMLSKLGIQKSYDCLDTFGGFVKEQFENDADMHKVPAKNGAFFASNSKKLVQKILKIHNREDITLIQGDIVSFNANQLNTPISICLLDVDLEIPIYEGLKKIYPLLSENGVILVDDCPEGTSWGGARKGYESFMKEIGLAPKYKFGFGVLNKN